MESFKKFILLGLVIVAIAGLVWGYKKMTTARDGVIDEGMTDVANTIEKTDYIDYLQRISQGYVTVLNGKRIQSVSKDMLDAYTITFDDDNKTIILKKKG